MPKFHSKHFNVVAWLCPERNLTTKTSIDQCYILLLKIVNRKDFLKIYSTIKMHACINLKQNKVVNLFHKIRMIAVNITLYSD